MSEDKRLTWTKYMVLSKIIENLRVKDKRALFHMMRTIPITENSFFPYYGFTAGEFSVWHVLSESGRKRRTR
jgi:hypothetical protein